MNSLPSLVRCAIYTRKSSEEGLEQSFNSLDAQREACQAFVLSQRQEGWRVLPNRYDDGGYSGGTMERPGLQRLMKDVEDHKVDTIVVYKVDRLTRSLADFAKIVEALDARGVSFVSVTQQFNTTSSMGRLTLNVLLSFAQFEREVTGERIRDKIAASKKKGLWMGGAVPLGYETKERKLIVIPDEAKVVTNIYKLYLKLGCVSKLKAHLDREGVKSKIRVSASGRRSGANDYARGALYRILQNRIYLGKIPHRDQTYEGDHEAIVPMALWDKVQAKLSSDHQGRRNGVKAITPSLLTGLLKDPQGKGFTPCHTAKNGKRYHYYYVPQPASKVDKSNRKVSRVPAHQIESLVLSRLQSFLGSDNDLIDELRLADTSGREIQKIVDTARATSKRLTGDSNQARLVLNHLLDSAVVHHDRVEIFVIRENLRLTLTQDLRTIPTELRRSKAKVRSNDLVCLTVEAQFKHCGGEVRLVVLPRSNGESPTYSVSSLLKAVARGRDWYERILEGKASGPRSLSKQTGLDERYTHRVLRCAFLAPDIVEAILDGRQPPELHLESLLAPLPLSWAEQRRQLRFPAAK